MSNFLRPCVALAPADNGNGGFFGPQSYWAWNNPVAFSQARTPWVRIWVQWRHLQPVGPGGSIPGASQNGPYDPLFDDYTQVLPNTTPQLYLLHIDAQITEARRTGRRVILTLVHPPAWENDIWSTLGPRPSDRSQEQAPPWWVDNNSWFAYIIGYLATRYNKKVPGIGNRWVDFLEVANEPNLVWWPQRLYSQYGGGQVLHEWAARMLKVARYITRFYTANEPIILGPGMSDADDVRFEGTIQRTRAFSEFMPAMLDHMRSLDAADGYRTDDAYTAWSHHNYWDVKYEFSGPNNRARRARDILASRGWAGWRDQENNAILITEGGVTPDGAAPPGSTFAQRLAAQSQRVSSAWNRLYASPAGEGASIGMMTNYLMWSDRFSTSLPPYENDTGLLNPPFCDPQTPTCGPDDVTINPYRDVFAAWAYLPTTYQR